MNEQTNRRAFILGVGAVAASQAAGDAAPAPGLNPRKPALPIRILNPDGQYVPITVAVPDSIASGEILYYTVTFGTNVPSVVNGQPNQAEVHVLSEVYSGGAWNEDNGPIGNNRLTVYQQGEDADFLTLMLTVYNTNSPNETEVRLKVSRKPDFSADYGYSGSIFVYDP